MKPRLAVMGPQTEQVLKPCSGMCQHCDLQSYFPLGSLPFNSSLVFLQNQPVPFTPHSWQLEAEAVSKPVAAR